MYYNNTIFIIIKYYLLSSWRAVPSFSYTGMIFVIPTRSSVSCTSLVRQQRANRHPPSSVRCAISAIYPIDLLLRYVRSTRLKSVRALLKSPISLMIFGKVESTFVSSSSPWNENTLIPVLVLDFLTSSWVSIMWIYRG